MENTTLKKALTALSLPKDHSSKKKSCRLIKPISLRNHFLVFIFISSLSFGYGQNEKAKDSLWFKEGKVGVLINQANFGEWLGGGTNNFNGIVNLDYKIQYQKALWDWTTILDASLGFTKTESSAFHKKTVDHLELSSVLARLGEKSWGFSASVNLKSQWIAGYVFSEGIMGEEISTQTTAFLSPLYSRVGIGFTFKKSKAFSLQVEPLAGRLIYVSDRFTRDLALGETYFGVKPNQQTRWEAGFSLYAQGEWPLFPNVTILNKLNIISNYLEDFENLDLDYTLGINMKINNYLTTQLEIQLVYDDNALAKLQSRQVFGVSIGLSF